MTHISRRVSTIVGLSALAAGWGWVPGAIAQDSIPVTGGDINFSNAQIYVPNAGDSGATIINGVTPDSFLIRTSQGDIPMNAAFDPQILPSLSTAPGAVPAVGDTGTIKGSLSFVGFTADGLQGFYSNIPADLNFQVTEASFTDLGAFNRYDTEPFDLIRFGSISTPVSFTSVTVTDPVVGVQYQPDGTPPEDQVLLGENIPASAYQLTSDGLSYQGPIAADLTGGEVFIPPNIGLGNGDPDTAISTPNIVTPAEAVTLVGFTSIFVFPISTVPIGTALGEGQGTPVMPTTDGDGDSAFLPPVPDASFGVFVFVMVPSGLWFDPPTAEAFAFEMQPAPQPLGLGSRVFPGLTGRREQTSLFTQISGLPEGIDADDRFTVSVGDVVLGEFTAQQTVDFRQYRQQLGDLLVNGEGVESFVVSGIEPGVDPNNSRAFPIKLDFNTPTASFEMKAQGVELAGNQPPVARMSKTPIATR